MRPVLFRRQECHTAAHDTKEYIYVKPYTGGGTVHIIDMT